MQFQLNPTYDHYCPVEEAVLGADPKWRGARECHDWRKHVPNEIREIWETFSLPQKALIVRWAEALEQAAD